MSARSMVFIGALVAFGAVGCGGGSDYGGATTTPTSPSATAGVVTVSIVGSSGNRSYMPNPVAVADGGQLMFRNDDSTAHRILMDDGSVDFGTLAPGATSAARPLTSGRFHCSIHPTMVGSINTATAPEPASNDGGDGY